MLARLSRFAAPKKRPTAHTTYLIGIEGSPFVKIGYTSGNPRTRRRSLQVGHPMQLALLWFCSGDFEDDLHDRFAAFRHRGEWFDLSALGDPVEVVSAAVEELRAARRDNNA